jgi:hypothetical protein
MAQNSRSPASKSKVLSSNPTTAKTKNKTKLRRPHCKIKLKATGWVVCLAKQTDRKTRQTNSKAWFSMDIRFTFSFFANY